MEEEVGPEESCLIQGWLACVRSDATRSAYSHDIVLLQRFANETGTSLKGLASNDVSRWRDQQSESSATIARRMSAASSFFQYAMAQGAVDANPVLESERPKGVPAQSVLADDEGDLVLCAAEGLGSKTAALVCLLLLDGMRLDIILATDLVQVTGTSRVFLSLPESTVKLDKRTSHHVREQAGGRTDGPLLTGDSATGEGKGRLTRFGAHYLIKRAGRDAHLEQPLNAGLLRRTWRAHHS